MKKMLKRVISAGMCLAVLICGMSFTSCSDNSPIILEYKGFSISQNEFTYELAVEKTTFLSENGYSTDDSSIWSTTNDEGVSVDVACMNTLVRQEVLKLYFASYAEENGYGITSEEEKYIDQSMAEYVNNFVDRKAFDAYMSNFGVNYDVIRKLLRLQYLSQKGQALLYDEGGSEEITDSDVVDYFNKNYVTVKHIYINNVNKTYPNQKTVPLTESEKADKNALIEKIEKELTAENFSQYASYSDDSFTDSESGGVTISRGDSGMSEYDDAVFAASVGAVSKAECADGVYFILKQPLDATVLTDDLKKELNTKMIDQSFEKIYQSIAKEVTVDREQLNLFSFSSALYFTTFEEN